MVPKSLERNTLSEAGSNRKGKGEAKKRIMQSGLRGGKMRKKKSPHAESTLNYEQNDQAKSTRGGEKEPNRKLRASGVGGKHGKKKILRLKGEKRGKKGLGGRILSIFRRMTDLYQRKRGEKRRDRATLGRHDGWLTVPRGKRRLLKHTWGKEMHEQNRKGKQKSKSPVTQIHKS